MVERIGYPDSILNDTELDGMYKEVFFISSLLYLLIRLSAKRITQTFNDKNCH